MLMCLRAFSPEFVVYRLSLVRNWQGCVVAVSASLSRYNSTFAPAPISRELNSKRIFKSELWLPSTERNVGKRLIMGSTVSRGRSYNPSKHIPDNPPPYPGRARYSCTDGYRKNKDYVEGVVCREDELKENQMKVVSLGDEGGKVLLVKQDGKVTALGTKCTHYGAPLVNGHLGKGRIRCQWHGACFSIITGDIEDFPGMDSLPCYEVKIRDGNITVRAERQLLKTNKRVKPFMSTVQPMKSTFLVVGGGPAGANCVETLRQLGYSGRLIFVLGENYLPYDRVKLSKSLDSSIENIALRNLDFYRERNIEVIMDAKLINLDIQTGCASLDNHKNIYYSKVFLATGSSPRTLSVPGGRLRNIFVLRTLNDANEISRSLSKEANVVILGNSFIGMELAASCVDKVNSVVVVGIDIPFKSIFGLEIGNRIVKLFESRNVSFRLNETIVEFVGENGELSEVVLRSGNRLPATVCIVGIGAIPNTQFLHDSELEKDGSIEVNQYLQTNMPNVFAGGDIAAAPVFGNKTRIGHWGLANYHGHVAAHNMMGRKKSLKPVPFFWTVLFGKGFRYAGYTTTFDEIVIHGSVEELKFIAFYCKKDAVVAVTTVNRDPLAARFAEELYEGKKLLKERIDDWISKDHSAV